MSRVPFQITTAMLQAVGCKIRVSAGCEGHLFPPQEAVSPNGYIVAHRSISVVTQNWKLANRSKGRWRKVKFRVKANSLATAMEKQ